MKWNSLSYLAKFFHIDRIPLSYFAIFISLFALSCDKDDEAPGLPDLNTYLQRFEEEARVRGFDFDLSVVEAAYVDEIMIDDRTYCGWGYSNYFGSGTRRIEISTADYCNWEDRSDIERENLFFHEIGHAFFNRSHDESSLCDGSPLSLMSSTRDNFKIYTEAGSEKRDYYISELIDKTAALDQCIDYQEGWVNDSVFYQFVYEDEAWAFDSRGGYYTGTQSPGEGQRSDAINIASIPEISTVDAARWIRSILNPNIPECADVTLRVTINSEMLSGVGAVISLRAFHVPVGREGAQREEYLYLTTTDTPVTGELNGYVEELTIPCFSRKTTLIVLFLRMMGETEGQVSFEDIQLVVNEK
jgi:hypothetical protein